MYQKSPFTQKVNTHTMGHKKFSQESIRLIINMQIVLK